MAPTNSRSISETSPDEACSTVAEQSIPSVLRSATIRSFKPLCVLSALAFLVVGMASEAQGATPLYFQGFETLAPSNSWNYTIGDPTRTMVSTQISGQSPSGQQVYEGFNSLQHSNRADVAVADAVVGTVTFATVDVSQFSGQYTGLYIELRLSSTSATPGNGNDVDDYFKMFTSVNGAAFEADSLTNVDTNADISLAGRGNARWGFTAVPSSSLPQAIVTAGGNQQLQAPQTNFSENNYSVFRINLDPSTDTIGLRLNFLNNNTGEFWNVDNVAIYGTAVPEPSKMLLLTFGLLAAGFRRSRPKAR